VITTEQRLAGSVFLFGFAMSGLDELLADVEGLSVDPVVSTPAPATRGKSTIGGGERPSVSPRYSVLRLVLRRLHVLLPKGQRRRSVLG
jgi:hypothetical protein